jgi:hypothetical protein
LFIHTIFALLSNISYLFIFRFELSHRRRESEKIWEFVRFIDQEFFGNFYVPRRSQRAFAKKNKAMLARLPLMTGVEKFEGNSFGEMQSRFLQALRSDKMRHLYIFSVPDGIKITNLMPPSTNSLRYLSVPWLSGKQRAQFDQFLLSHKFPMLEQLNANIVETLKDYVPKMQENFPRLCALLGTDMRASHESITLFTKEFLDSLEQCLQAMPTLRRIKLETWGLSWRGFLAETSAFWGQMDTGSALYFDNLLSRYPRTLRVLHLNGGRGGGLRSGSLVSDTAYFHQHGLNHQELIRVLDACYPPETCTLSDICSLAREVWYPLSTHYNDEFISTVLGVIETAFVKRTSAGETWPEESHIITALFARCLETQYETTDGVPFEDRFTRIFRTTKRPINIIANGVRDSAVWVHALTTDWLSKIGPHVTVNEPILSSGWLRSCADIDSCSSNYPSNHLLWYLGSNVERLKEIMEHPTFDPLFLDRCPDRPDMPLSYLISVFLHYFRPYADEFEFFFPELERLLILHTTNDLDPKLLCIPPPVGESPLFDEWYESTPNKDLYHQFYPKRLPRPALTVPPKATKKVSAKPPAKSPTKKKVAAPAPKKASVPSKVIQTAAATRPRRNAKK